MTGGCVPYSVGFPDSELKDSAISPVVAEAGMVADSVIASLRRLRQEDCCECRITLRYILSSRLA